MAQILYIVGGNNYIPELTNDEETLALLTKLPPKPQYFPIDIFTKLYSVPIRPDSMEALRLTMFNKEDKWNQFLHGDVTCPPKALPWKVVTDEEMELTLSDLVILRTVSPLVLQSCVFKDAVQFSQALPFLSLRDVLAKGKDPLIVIYNDKDILSQANTIVFEKYLTEVHPVSNFGFSTCTCTCNLT